MIGFCKIGGAPLPSLYVRDVVRVGDPFREKFCMGSTIGLIMVGTAIAMLIVARPRNGEVVGWLPSEYRNGPYNGVTALADRWKRRGVSHG